MEQNVNCRSQSIVFHELNQNGSFAVLHALQQRKKKKNKNLIPHLHLQNILMRNREFILFGLILTVPFGLTLENKPFWQCLSRQSIDDVMFTMCFNGIQLRQRMNSLKYNFSLNLDKASQAKKGMKILGLCTFSSKRYRCSKTPRNTRWQKVSREIYIFLQYLSEIVFNVRKD